MCRKCFVRACVMCRASITFHEEFARPPSLEKARTDSSEPLSLLIFSDFLAQSNCPEMRVATVESPVSDVEACLSSDTPKFRRPNSYSSPCIPLPLFVLSPSHERFPSVVLQYAVLNTLSSLRHTAVRDCWLFLLSFAPPRLLCIASDRSVFRNLPGV